MGTACFLTICLFFSLNTLLKIARHKSDELSMRKEETNCQETIDNLKKQIVDEKNWKIFKRKKSRNCVLQEGRLIVEKGKLEKCVSRGEKCMFETSDDTH